MSENERFILIQNGTLHTVRDNAENKSLGTFEFKDNEFPVYACFHMIIDLMNDLSEENEMLKDKIYVLEDDNETYYKSLEKLNLYTKRFIPTKCTNEFKDCKTNRYYWLDHKGNFEGCLELLNLLDRENELLESENSQLKGKLMEYEEQIKGDVND